MKDLEVPLTRKRVEVSDLQEELQIRFRKFHKPIKGKCKVCRKIRNDLSRKEICVKCSMTRMGDSMNQMINKKGPYYDKWKVAMRKAMRRL